MFLDRYRKKNHALLSNMIYGRNGHTCLWLDNLINIFLENKWWHYRINGGYWISDHNQIKWKTNNTTKWGKVDITDHFWHHRSFLTSQIISDITDGFWHHRSFLTSQIVSVRNDLWCQKQSVMSEMICDVRNDLWCQKWSVMSEIICDVRNDLWCQKRSVMSETI
jgi:hypothetical protein